MGGWILLGVELIAFATLARQRSVAEARGNDSWLLVGADPWLERAIDGGQPRLAANPRLPLSEPRLQSALWYTMLAVTVWPALPGLVAVEAEGWHWTAGLAVYLIVMFVGLDVVATVALVIALWRGWIDPPDDDDEGDDDVPSGVPGADGPWTRAHMFSLLR